MAYWTWADDRGVLRVGGAEAEAFLQGLVSNDIGKAGPDTAVYAALLTPQGKFLHDFFVLRQGDDFLLECNVGAACPAKTYLKIHGHTAQNMLRRKQCYRVPRSAT